MSKKLQIFQVFYRLRSDESNTLHSKYCLAFNGCHSVQVLIRNLVAFGYALDDIQYEKSVHITSYR
jgi:hypothetical protein